jgi:hypothetical protein
MVALRHDMYQKTVQDIVNLYEDGHLNLSPGFQRDSVWTERDRAKLVDSIMRNYPIPAIFLYRRSSDGEIIYDVIDGKQRIESILMFMGAIRGNRFWARVQLPGEEEKDWVDWNTLRRMRKQNLINGYSLRTIEVDGDPAGIIDLFVRINSTGKALTAAEKRHARYYNSHFLREAGRLAKRYENYFKQQNILSSGQITRMKHVELICELMISINQGDVINKKAALDRVMESDSFTKFQVKTAKDKTVRSLNRLKRMFPRLSQTRFHQISDFYSLAILIAKFEEERLILTEPKRNRRAWELLVAFSNGVDTVRERQKKALGPNVGQESYRDYLLTVIQSTDEVNQRRNREQILRGLLQNLFKRKDSERFFSPEQRRILWNSASERKCAKCGKQVTWSDLTIDHINPFSKGGSRKLENAALMHRSCNASKGNR